MDDWLAITGILANLALVGGALWAVFAFSRTQKQARAATTAAQDRDNRDWDARLLAKASVTLTALLLETDSRKAGELLFRLDHIAWQFRVLYELSTDITAWVSKEVLENEDGVGLDLDGVFELQKRVRDAPRTLYPKL